ncbi:ApeI family dehydratase [Solimonas flava]|uniref:ApeI family dehydratase n=1 Tax=Solimonas flava TaxID=415849 RepID=UPI00040F9386|nr:hypothetical protein [Solimonas flava]
MNLDPQPLAVRPDGDDAIEIQLAVPAALPCFADHFPSYPMLPGVLQLGWAVRLAQQHFGLAGPMQEVAQLKFQHPIRPDSALTLRLVRSGAREIAFSYRSADRACSAGRLSFADAA